MWLNLLLSPCVSKTQSPCPHCRVSQNAAGVLYARLVIGERSVNHTCDSSEPRRNETKNQMEVSFGIEGSRKILCLFLQLVLQFCFQFPLSLAKLQCQTRRARQRRGVSLRLPRNHGEDQGNGRIVPLPNTAIFGMETCRYGSHS